MLPLYCGTALRGDVSEYVMDSPKRALGRVNQSPLLFLRLECSSDALMTIHFGIEHVDQSPALAAVTAAFLRMLFKETAYKKDGIDIEDCVKTDWFIKSCSEMFEYVEERNKYHTFKQLKYKRAPQQKNVLAVA